MTLNWGYFKELKTVSVIFGFSTALYSFSSSRLTESQVAETGNNESRFHYLCLEGSKLTNSYVLSFQIMISVIQISLLTTQGNSPSLECDPSTNLCLGLGEIIGVPQVARNSN